MKNKERTIVLTGGGTAGHIMPNMALLPELKKHFTHIYYIGTNGMEKEIVKKFNIDFYEIKATKLVRKLTLKNLLIPFKLINSICSCKKLLKKLQPDVIFAKGGFVSLPVAIAGKKLNIPVLCHESDLSIGLSNKIIAHYSKALCTSFKQTALSHKKAVFTGSPIRQEILSGNKQKVETTNLDPTKKNLLFLGGSLGSKAINDVIYDNLEQLTKSYNVIHIAGKTGKKKDSKNYIQLSFTNNLQDYYDLADVVICRSGANTIFELLAISKPMILIPLPKDQSRGDQIENAEYFKKQGYANVLDQNLLNINTLLNSINLTLKNKDRMIEKQKKCPLNEANKNIVNLILKYCKN